MRRARLAQGTIKKLVCDRAFGFILPEGAALQGSDLFFHCVDADANGHDGLQEDQAVSYEVGKDERWGTPKAKHVVGA